MAFFHKCLAGVKMLISSNKMKYIWYLPEKGKFYFIFIV